MKAENKITELNAEYLLELEEPLSEPLKVKLGKVKALKKSGEVIYKKNYAERIPIGDIRESYSSLEIGHKTESTFKIAGRVMIFRKHGKATFADVRDFTGEIQLYANLKNIGEEEYNKFLDLDIGDWIGAEGNIFKTRTGELSMGSRTKS
jgi:lysyl-tRNA synthetase class 2